MNWTGRIPIWIKNPKHRRSLGGLLMALIMAPFVVSVLACLEAPIGNPSTSKVDPKLSGVWFGKHNGEPSLLVLQPYDKRTYLIGWFVAETDEGEKQGEKQGEELKKDVDPKGGREKLEEIEFKGQMISKGWLTTIGGEQFMCWEPMFQLDKKKGMKPKMWYGWLVKLKKNKLSLSLIEAAGETTKEIEKNLAKATKAGDFAERVADADAENGGDIMRLEKIDKSKYDEVAEALEKMGLSIE